MSSSSSQNPNEYQNGYQDPTKTPPLVPTAGPPVSQSIPAYAPGKQNQLVSEYHDADFFQK